MDQFHFVYARQLALRFNVAPTQDVGILRATPQGRAFSLVRWGLIPSWAKEKSVGNRMINARGETAAVKPSFRSAWKHRRCLVLADGYYEWKKEGAQKIPYYIRLLDERAFAMAGLWETWSGPPGRPLDSALETCTILTTQANPLTVAIHDRMPVILVADDYDLWLDPEMRDSEVLQRFMQPNLSEEMRLNPVSTHVNNPRNDDPACVASVLESASDA